MEYCYNMHCTYTASPMHREEKNSITKTTLWAPYALHTWYMYRATSKFSIEHDVNFLACWAVICAVCPSHFYECGANGGICYNFELLVCWTFLECVLVSKDVKYCTQKWCSLGGMLMLVCVCEHRTVSIVCQQCCTCTYPCLTCRYRVHECQQHGRTFLCNVSKNEAIWTYWDLGS